MDRDKYTLTRRGFLQAALFSPAVLSVLGVGTGSSGVCFGEDLREGAVEPTVEEALKAIEAMNETSMLDVTQERLDACAVLQNSVDRLRAAEFGKYFRSTPEEAKAEEDKRAILRFLNSSFDKVLKELTETEVPEGSVMLWHVYNMGYVVKTPTQAFAIDIKHRRANELIPYIDFLLITHPHGDHFTGSFNNALAEAGKPVVSNFIDNEWKTPKEEGREYRFGDISIKTTLVDHNKNAVKFVSMYEIDCGPKSGNCIILHSGDGNNNDQVIPTRPVDVFIPHMAVGLNIPKAVNETVKPAATLLSHHLELGHPINLWRWSYEYGYNIVKACENDSVYLPVWGERYTFKRA